MALTIVARGEMNGAAARITARQPCDGIAETISSVSNSASASASVTITRVRQRNVGQVDGVRPPFGDLGGERRIARPQPDVVPDAPEMDRERRAPTARAEHRHAAHQARAPMRRSVPEPDARQIRPMAKHDQRRRGTSPRSRSASGLPMAYAIGGSAADASTDPTEMYFVSQADDEKDDQGRRKRNRRQRRETRRTPSPHLCRRETQPHGINVPDNRRQTGHGRCRYSTPLKPRRQQHAGGTLPHVEQRDEHASR